MKLTVLVVALLVLLGGGGFFYLRDTTAPQVVVRPDSGPISNKRAPTLEVQDSGSGLKSVQVLLVQNGTSKEIFNQTFAEGTASRAEQLSLANTGLSDGTVEVRVIATDHSIYHFGSGNRTEQSFRFEYDAKPPIVAAVSIAHNINQGGAGLVIYTVSEEVEKTGIQVGEYFFPGFRQQGNHYACLFPFPWNMNVSQFTPRLVAVDKAGNERIGGFLYHLNARTFPTDRIEIGQAFLEAKMPEFAHFYPDTGDLLQLFLKVNGEMRAQNVNRLLEIGRQTADRPLWDGAFQRQLGAPRGLFAQGRTYLHAGKEIDRATHLGFDIAGLAQMPVIAANRGKVVFADYLGIYGNCLIIDHGLGLQSLYAHLSQMEAKVGDTVEKGMEVARSGASGMAGGDHLHFGMLVHGIEVMPLEWWDPSWVDNNITGKLAEIPGASAY